MWRNATYLSSLAIVATQLKVLQLSPRLKSLKLKLNLHNTSSLYHSLILSLFSLSVCFLKKKF